MTRSYVQLDKAKNNLGEKMDGDRLGNVVRQTVQIGGKNASDVADVDDGAVATRDRANPGSLITAAAVDADLTGDWQALLVVNTDAPREKFKIMNTSTAPMSIAYSTAAPDNADAGSEMVPGKQTDGLCFYREEDVKVHQGAVWVKWPVGIAGSAIPSVWKRS